MPLTAGPAKAICQLQAGITRDLFDCRDSAKEVERYAPYDYTVLMGDIGMAQLVQSDACEEHYRKDQGIGPSEAGGLNAS